MLDDMVIYKNQNQLWNRSSLVDHVASPVTSRTSEVWMSWLAVSLKIILNQFSFLFPCKNSMVILIQTSGPLGTLSTKGGRSTMGLGWS